MLSSHRSQQVLRGKSCGSSSCHQQQHSSASLVQHSYSGTLSATSPIQHVQCYLSHREPSNQRSPDRHCTEQTPVPARVHKGNSRLGHQESKSNECCTQPTTQLQHTTPAKAPAPNNPHTAPAVTKVNKSPYVKSKGWAFTLKSANELGWRNTPNYQHTVYNVHNHCTQAYIVHGAVQAYSVHGELPRSVHDWLPDRTSRQ